MEEQLLQITIEVLEMSLVSLPCGRLARPILADIESGTRENEVITPWSQIPNLIQLVQGTEQALPLYDHRKSPTTV